MTKSHHSKRVEFIRYLKRHDLPVICNEKSCETTRDFDLELDFLVSESFGGKNELKNYNLLCHKHKDLKKKGEILEYKMLSPILEPVKDKTLKQIEILKEVRIPNWIYSDEMLSRIFLIGFRAGFGRGKFLHEMSSDDISKAMREVKLLSNRDNRGDQVMLCEKVAKKMIEEKYKNSVIAVLPEDEICPDFIVENPDNSVMNIEIKMLHPFTKKLWFKRRQIQNLKSLFGTTEIWIFDGETFLEAINISEVDLMKNEVKNYKIKWTNK